ncbi:VOC family protein [Moheibacter sp.]|uniref:VOC family protein n=1 Tax=Moheibacter sp. TaxID=1965316 RepID=UPI003C732971
MKLPENHQTLMPYLILGDARGFLEFAQNVFDAEILLEHLDDDNRIIHAEIKIGESTIMIGQSNEFWGVNNAGMFIYVKNADFVYNHAIQQGAESIMEPSDKDYGRSCGVKDPFGNIWWITSF